MSNVIDFKEAKKRKLFGSEIVTNRAEYLRTARRVLPHSTYVTVLLAILDKDLYNHSDERIKTVVDCYYNNFKE